MKTNEPTNQKRIAPTNTWQSVFYDAAQLTFNSPELRADGGKRLSRREAEQARRNTTGWIDCPDCGHYDTKLVAGRLECQACEWRDTQ